MLPQPEVSLVTPSSDKLIISRAVRRHIHCEFSLILAISETDVAQCNSPAPACPIKVFIGWRRFVDHKPGARERFWPRDLFANGMAGTAKKSSSPLRRMPFWVCVKREPRKGCEPYAGEKCYGGGQEVAVG